MPTRLPPGGADPKGSLRFPQGLCLDGKGMVAARTFNAQVFVATIDAIVEILQIVEIGGKETFDRLWRNLLHIPQPDHHAREQDDQ